MPKYAIISQVPYGGKELSLQGKTVFSVILKADDDTTESQVYIGDEATLVEAAKHFQKEKDVARQKQVDTHDPNKQPPQPVFVDVAMA